MADVTRFPRYHQVENVVTNHVMVMLRTLYDASPKLLEALLRALCADEVSVGPRFAQQIAGAHSVPDGLVLQEPLAVFIETKLGSIINPDQLQRHCRTIVERLSGRKGNVLISLTSGQIGQTIPETVTKMAQEHSITVIPLTFGELVTQVAALPVVDLALKETIQEFTDFIVAQGLVPREEQIVVAMLTGTSWRENLAHGVYYEPVHRSPKWRGAAFLGLYHDKRVSHVGRIMAAVAAVRDNAGELVFEEPDMGILNDQQKQAIRDVIQAAQVYYPDFETSPHRYYVVDTFTETNFCKTSPGGMMNFRYFDVEQICKTRLPPHASGLIAAQALGGHTFD